MLRLIGLGLLVLAGLTALRVPAFQSDRALWFSALPSDRPRINVNVAAALLTEGEIETGVLFSVRALELTQAPERAYERAAVETIVRAQLRWANLFSPVCDRPRYQPHC